MITLLYLDAADKALILYLYVLLCIWIISRMHRNEKDNSVAKIAPTVNPPTTTYVQTNIFVAIRIVVNKLEKYISDELIDASEKQHIKKPLRLLPRQYELNCSKIEFLRSVIRWCRANLDNNKKRVINLEVKYSSHKTLMGEYRYFTKCIVIYWGSHKTLESICDTCIHEFNHSQHITCQKHQVLYDKLTRDKGYRDNPHEILARKVAEENRLKCLVDLYKLNIIKGA